MPPDGLWPIPLHHLYKTNLPRPSFSAKELEEVDNEQTSMDLNSLPHTDGTLQKDKEEEGNIGQKKTKGKKHRDSKHHLEQAAREGLAEGPEKKTSKRKRDLEIRDVDVGAQANTRKKRGSQLEGNATVSLELPFRRAVAKQTPVPLPPSSARPAPSTTREAQPTKPKAAIADAEMLVPETPTKRAAKNTRSPIKTPTSLGLTLCGQHSTPNSKPTTQSMTQRLLDFRQASSPAIQKKASRSSLPAPGLQKHEQKPSASSRPLSECRNKNALPLADETKAGWKARATSSSTPSLPSSQASFASIPDTSNRAGVLHARSGAVVDTSTSPKPKKAKQPIKYEEPSVAVFNQRFADLQTCVNFKNERKYLNQYLDWQADHASENPLPCMDQLSGCTPKKEQILRLSKGENVNISKAMKIHGGDANIIRDSSQHAARAEEFLILAILAQVPVPIGRLEGTWTLYFPKYSEHHFDRYGYGERKLFISSIAGFKHGNAYTAVLSVPPRPTPYTTLMFLAPPHASFRITAIETAAEHCKMDVIFLGNGFLHLRVDLNLLLKGRPTEMRGGKQVWMEFIGVHEKALEWVEAKETGEDIGEE